MRDQPIHVLFIVNSLHFGGAEKHVVTLLNSLDSSRFRLSLAYLKDEQALLPQVDLNKLQGRLYCCHISKKLDFQAARRLADQLRDDAVDIVVCTNTYSLLYGWLARRFSRLHPQLVEVFHSTKMGSLKEKMQMLFYRPFFHACDMLVYICENQRHYWRKRVLRAKDETVINNGIDVAHFVDCYTPDEKLLLRRKYGFFADEYVVGLCAALRPEKAHGDILQAIAILKKSKIDVKCLFIGDGPEREKIEDRIHAMGLSQHVSITGFMSDVRPAIAACDVMALISSNETFSIAALESMALGKPMIMSLVGGAAEQVSNGENGYLYARQDIAALANALRKLHDPLKSAAMGDRARLVTAQKFSLAAMSDAYTQLFINLVEKNSEKNSAAEKIVRSNAC